MAALRKIIAGLRSENKQLEDEVREVSTARWAEEYEKYCLDQRVSELEEENTRLLRKIAELERNADL